MRFLIDECPGKAVGEWLTSEGHDVTSVSKEARSASDGIVLAMAFREQRVLITTDKDFGERIFAGGERHHGVVFLRLANERVAVKIAVIQRLMRDHAHQLEDAFIVVTQTHVRISRTRDQSR